MVANIRGGGEFGPAWHEAGLKTHRQRIYDDFAAVAEDLIARGFSDQWATLSSTLPGNASSIQSRIDFLSKRENRKLASGVDLNEARSDLTEAEALWTKAEDAHSQGNLEQAVTIAKTVQTKLGAVAASMKLNLAEPAAVTDTST